MKRQYMKPAMRVVRIQKRVHILAGSEKTMQIHSGEGNQIEDEQFVW
ncbi:MAG: hypothetical protein II184_04635 [Clostridia bacterium]|nr:hypothetical protein [Clostridia bacterium]